jgi:hypothetical protein
MAKKRAKTLHAVNRILITCFSTAYVSQIKNLCRTTMLADLKEKQEKWVVVNRTNPSALWEFLKFLHFPKINFEEIAEDVLLDICALAHQYNVGSLVAAVYNYMLNSLKVRWRTFSCACARQNSTTTWNSRQYCSCLYSYDGWELCQRFLRVIPCRINRIGVVFRPLLGKKGFP